jgi:ferric-dicitrate binding protein FerR (iron transport regulator)
VKRQLAYQVCYVIAAVAAFGGSANAAGIATVTDVVNEGYRTPPGHEEQTAKRADELVQDEALRTDAESSIAVTFVDGSELNVEAESELVLSDYVFDGAASKGLINLNDGLFHFTSNGKPDQGVKLKTPVATIGVRGTEFLVHVDGADATIIDIMSGAVEAKPNGTGKSIVCVGGQSILIAGPNQDALCGDLGSFSAAAGSPGRDHRPEPGHGGQSKDKEKPKGKDKERPAPDPDPDQGEGSGSGTMLFIDEELFDLA